MNQKYLLVIILILTVIGVAFILTIDKGSNEEELSIISQGEWKGYYNLTLNGTTTHEAIMGGGSLNFTIKRQLGDKLVVYVNDTGYGNTQNLEIRLLENNRVIAQNSSSNHSEGVWLYN